MPSEPTLQSVKDSTTTNSEVARQLCAMPTSVCACLLDRGMDALLDKDGMVTIDGYTFRTCRPTFRLLDFMGRCVCPCVSNGLLSI